MTLVKDTSEDAYDPCPLSKEGKKLTSGRRCRVDNKPCYTAWMWVYRVCKVAKQQPSLKVGKRNG